MSSQVKGGKKNSQGRRTASKSVRRSDSRKANRTRSGSRGNTQRSGDIPDALYTEISILLLLAFCVILILGNFGLTLRFGDVLNSLFFGIFGGMEYIFPFFLFFGACFYLVNRENNSALLRLVSMVIIFLDAGMFLQLFVSSDYNLGGYSGTYDYSMSNRSGGGVISGSLFEIMNKTLGKPATVIIMVIILLICLLIVTGQSIFKLLSYPGSEIADRARESRIEREKDREALREERRLIRDEEKERRSRKREELREEKRRKLREDSENKRKDFFNFTVGDGREKNIPVVPEPMPSNTADENSFMQNKIYEDDHPGYSPFAMSPEHMVKPKDYDRKPEPRAIPEVRMQERIVEELAVKEPEIEEGSGDKWDSPDSSDENRIHIDRDIWEEIAGREEEEARKEAEAERLREEREAEERRIREEREAEERRLREKREAEEKRLREEKEAEERRRAEEKKREEEARAAKEEKAHERIMRSHAVEMHDMHEITFDEEDEYPFSGDDYPEAPEIGSLSGEIEDSAPENGGLPDGLKDSAPENGNLHDGLKDSAPENGSLHDEIKGGTPENTDLYDEWKEDEGEIPEYPDDEDETDFLSGMEADEGEEIKPEDTEEEFPEEPEGTKEDFPDEEEESEEDFTEEPGETGKPEEPEEKPYELPPVSLLRQGGMSEKESENSLRSTAEKLREILQSFGVKVKMLEYIQGPTVTRFEMQPEQGVKVSTILNLSNDIQMNLAARDIRIEAPIPGKAAVGIEIPNKSNSPVMLRDLIESRAFQDSRSKITIAIGKDIGGETIVYDIDKMPHLLIAGATGSGKSVCINTIIMSILYKARPDEVKLIMIDPKVVELSIYNGIPHLLTPVVTDPVKAAGALNWGVAEMMKRYQLFARVHVRNMEGYNEKVPELNKAGETLADGSPYTLLPQIIIIVDELADLMMVQKKDVEASICRLAQLARAAGIHLIIATQRPSVDVITGLIKANMPSRVAFAVSSNVDSRTILDSAGAEKLLGNGDMLFYPQKYPKPERLQGAFVSDEEVQDVTDFIRDQSASADEREDIAGEIEKNISSQDNRSNNDSPEAADETDDGRDAYFQDAGRLVTEKNKATIGVLQRVFRIGFNRAARIMDQLAEAGVVSGEDGTKPRQVLMTKEEFEEFISGSEEDEG